MIDEVPSPKEHQIAAAITVALISEGEVFCSGVLIDHKTVLTAAHCVDEAVTPGAFEIGIYLGNLSAIQPRPLKSSAVVGSIEVHPDYDKSIHKHDLAKLFLKEPLDSKITLPRLATDQEISRIKIGSGVYSWGYGTASLQNYTPEKHQFVGSIDRTNPQSGALAVKNFISDTMPGDSGAPVFLNDCSLHGMVLVGINIGQARPTGSYSFFTPLIHYTDWLSAKNQGSKPKAVSRGWPTWWRTTSACMFKEDPQVLRNRFEPVHSEVRQSVRSHPYIKINAIQYGICRYGSIYQKGLQPVFF